jgi:hypothetical protein
VHQVGLGAMDAFGSNGLRRPYCAAVPGVNWAMPWAPAPLIENGLKFDSA